MGVCWGKFAEGIDFSDEAAWACFVIGVPNPQIFDPKVILKKHYMKIKKQKNISEIDGEEWYWL